MWVKMLLEQLAVSITRSWEDVNVFLCYLQKMLQWQSVDFRAKPLS